MKETKKREANSKNGVSVTRLFQFKFLGSKFAPAKTPWGVCWENM